MQVRVLGKCRDNLKLYLLVEVSSCEITTLRISSVSVSTGVVLPAFYKVMHDKGSVYELAVVLFDTTVSQLVTFSDALGAAGGFTIYPLSSTVEAKLNSVLHRSMCSEIRNIDAQGLSSDIYITCNSLVPVDEDKALVKGLFTTPMHVNGAVEALNRKGENVGTHFTTMDVTERDRAIQDGMCWHHFAVEIPYEDHVICLVLRDDEGEQIGSCFVLESYRLKLLKEAMNQQFSSAFDQTDYENWLLARRLTGVQAQQQRETHFAYQPLFSIIVPLYKTPLTFFRDMADSVLQQTYANWELILVNSTPDISDLKELVDSYAQRDTRIKVVELEQNLGITANTNKGIEVASGDFLCFFDHDDTLEPDILFEYAAALNKDPEINLLYCDEDKILLDGRFGNPTFKPDFSLDMVRDNNYICHLLTVRKAVYDIIEPSGPELDGAQDHAMVLKIIEQGGHVYHAPRILYHWRMSATSTAANSDTKPYATVAGIKAVQQHLDRIGVEAQVENSHDRAFRYLVHYATPGNPLVSLIVPTRGEELLLTRFIAMATQAIYQNIEIVFVADAHKTASVAALVEHLQPRFSVRVIEDEQPFAFAYRLNIGAAAAQGDVLIFCHDDIEAMDAGWITTLVGHALRHEVGLVGTMTVSEDKTIQQAGLAYVNGEIIRLSVGNQFETPGYIYYPLTTRNTSLVDDACMAMRRDAYNAFGGFDERYQQYFAGADLSFRATKAGYLLVYTPEAAMYHYSSEAAFSNVASKSVQYFGDKATFMTTWAEELTAADPYFNPNFSHECPDAVHYRFNAVSGMSASSL